MLLQSDLTDLAREVLTELENPSTGSPDTNQVSDALRNASKLTETIEAARQGGVDRTSWLDSLLTANLDEGAWNALDDALFPQRLPSLVAARAIDLVAAGGVETITDAVFGDSESPIGLVVEALQEPFAGPAEHVVKTAAATATLRWLQDRGVTAPVAAVVAALDVGITSTKVAYKVATDELDEVEGTAIVLDRSAAAVAMVVEHAATVVGGNIGASVGAGLGALVGAAPVGAMVGRVVGAAAGETVGTAIRAGHEAIRPFLTQAVHDGWNTVKSAARDFARSLGFI